MHSKMGYLQFSGDVYYWTCAVLTCAWATCFQYDCLLFYSILFFGYGLLSKRDNTCKIGKLSRAEECSNFLSYCTFSWAKDLAYKSTEAQSLQVQDLFKLPKNFNIGEDCNAFEKNYRTLMKKPLLATEKQLYLCLWKIFSKQFILVIVITLVATVLTNLTPLLMYYFGKYLLNGSSLLNGVLLGAVIVSMDVFSNFHRIHAYYLRYKLHYRILGMLKLSVYRKLLRCKQSELQETDKSLNLLMNSTSQIANFVTNISLMSHTISSIAVATSVLYFEIGNLVFLLLSNIICFFVILKLSGVHLMNYTKEWNKSRQTRINMLNEILDSIKSVKCLVMENYFEKLMEDYVRKELHYQQLCLCVKQIISFFGSILSPISLMMIVSLLIFYNTSKDVPTIISVLTCTKVFLEILEAIPNFASDYYSTVVAAKSLHKFLLVPEYSFSEYYTPLSKNNSLDIRISNGFFKWNSKPTTSFCLNDINLEIEKGSLVAVIGKVGSGKSALLAAINGSLHKESGTVEISEAVNSIAVVTQYAWLQNATIRENIISGSSIDEDKYLNILTACDLLNDLKCLPHGDETVVGTGGISLSGGQKARIHLARAVYQDHQIYLLDDIFSTLDKNVSDHILSEVVIGILKGKTRIVCTHNINYMKHFEKVIFLNDGTIVKIGSEDVIHDIKSINIAEDFDTNNSTPSSNLTSNSVNSKNLESLSRNNCNLLATFWEYIYKCGVSMCILVIVLQLLMQVSYNASELCLSIWSSEKYDFLISRLHFDKDFALLITLLISSIAYIIFLFLRAIFYIKITSHPPKELHRMCIKKILSLKMSKLALTKVGLLLNVLNDNFAAVQIMLPEAMMTFLNPIFVLFGIFCVVGFSIPVIIPVLLILVQGTFTLTKYNRIGGTNLIVLLSNVYSPIYAYFNETLKGLVIIQSSNRYRHFNSQFQLKIEDFVNAGLNRFILQCWMTLRVYFLSTFALVLVISFCIYKKEFLQETLHPGFCILSISYLLTAKSLLKQVTASVTKIETGLIEFQRVHELSISNQKEIESLQSESMIPANWPSRGDITFTDISMKYRDDLPFVLRNLSFNIKSGEKVAIIGRTGSGKTSIFSTLYKLSDHILGKIVIDDICVDDLPLRQYRARIAMMPQDGFIFSGTVRSNLDHMHKYSDYELCHLLRKVKLSSTLERLGGLDVEICGSGSSFSFGEAQLFCLARAILQRAKILCLDEATANVDFETDKVIQNIIFTEMKSCTVLAIAHRFETVKNYDRILIIENGQLVGNGSPKQLQKSSHSFFHKDMSIH